MYVPCLLNLLLYYTWLYMTGVEGCHACFSSPRYNGLSISGVTDSLYAWETSESHTLIYQCYSTTGQSILFITSINTRTPNRVEIAVTPLLSKFDSEHHYIYWLAGLLLMFFTMFKVLHEPAIFLYYLSIFVLHTLAILF